ncbi:MAG: glycine cleavage system protein GcvH [Deltaproteobacteria bacterium]|nr:glycine cleavage system protein GcvH [Deltaproteobacteria bacterium]
MSVHVPDDLRYTHDHEWAKPEGGKVRIGITAFAVEQLGDITLVELPKVGTKVEAGKTFGTVESVKTLSDLFAPVAGTIVEVNEALSSNPELVNEGAYDKGWMVIIEPSDPKSVESLMDPAAYRKHLEAEAH